MSKFPVNLPLSLTTINHLQTHSPSANPLSSGLQPAQDKWNSQQGSDHSRLQTSLFPRERHVETEKSHNLRWRKARRVQEPLGPHGNGHNKDSFFGQPSVRLL